MRASPCCFVLRCGRLLSRPVLPSIRAPPSSHFFASCPSCRFFAANVQNIPVRGICMSGNIAVSFVLLGYAAFCIAFPQVTGSNAGWLSWRGFAYLPRTGIFCALAPIFQQLESRKKVYLAKRTLIPRNEHLTPSCIPSISALLSLLISAFLQLIVLQCLKKHVPTCVPKGLL